MSPFFHQWQQLMGAFKLLGDSAYDANDFPFIITPKRHPNAAKAARNLQLCKGRVLVENAFGRLKCRWRRLRDLVNTHFDIFVEIIISCCALITYAQGMTLSVLR